VVGAPDEPTPRQHRLTPAPDAVVRFSPRIPWQLTMTVRTTMPAQDIP